MLRLLKRPVRKNKVVIRHVDTVVGRQLIMVNGKQKEIVVSCAADN